VCVAYTDVAFFLRPTSAIDQGTTFVCVCRCCTSLQL